MTTIIVSFSVGLVCLVAGFFLGRRNATFILAKAMTLVDDSERVVQQIQELADKIKDGAGEEDDL